MRAFRVLPTCELWLASLGCSYLILKYREINMLKKLKKIDNFIGNFEQDYPNLYKIIGFFFIKRGIAGKLISLAGVALSPSLIVIVISYFFEKKDLSEVVKSSSCGIIFAILLVLLALCIYWTDSSAKKAPDKIEKNTKNSINYNIIRLKDKKISTRWPLISSLFVILVLSIFLAILAIPLVLSLVASVASALETNNISTFIFLSICVFAFLSFVGIIIILVSIYTILLALFSIKSKKVIFLPIDNLLIEYGKDKCLYLTKYEFICPKCEEVMKLNRTNGFKLQCTVYSEHNFNIDPVEFTKYSLPNLPSKD